MRLFKKNTTNTEIGYLKYWCIYGMSAEEMKDAGIVDQIAYLNELIKRYKHQLSKHEYESIKRSLKILELNHQMEMVKSNLHNKNLVNVHVLKYIDGDENNSN
jgi:hypothetical protein